MAVETFLPVKHRKLAHELSSVILHSFNHYHPLDWPRDSWLNVHVIVVQGEVRRDLHCKEVGEKSDWSAPGTISRTTWQLTDCYWACMYTYTYSKKAATNINPPTAPACVNESVLALYEHLLVETDMY